MPLFICSLRKTIQVLSEHEEALQDDFKNLQEKGLKERYWDNFCCKLTDPETRFLFVAQKLFYFIFFREEWSQTLGHYQAIWQDYKKVYEEIELAKKLQKEQVYNQILTKLFICSL